MATPQRREVVADNPTPEEIERHWFEHVYRGDRMPQLTVRAMVMGMLLGAVLSVSNIYVGLKAGWTVGVGITACILAYSAFASLHRLFPRAFPAFTILENNAMQSCATAAGTMVGGGMINAIPALMMLDPSAVPTNRWYLMLWLGVVSMLGVFLAVPAKRQMINLEQLPFPTGIAAATTLETLHAEGGQARQQARSLTTAGALGAAIAWFRDATWKGIPYPNIPATWGTSWISVRGYPLSQLTMSFEGSLLFVAAGALVGLRQGASMLLGAVINYVVLVPIMLDRHVIPAPTFREISSWSLWIGVPMMVTSGLFTFVRQWRTVVRAFSTITAFLRHQTPVSDAMERIEVPGSWFVIGFVAFGGLSMWLGHFLFHIVWWMGLIAVLATFLLVVVAARATGETDVTPIGPLSKITQLTFGIIEPGNITTNLMTANISAGATNHAGDLLTDLKSGYLLGANPRQQFVAQFLGVIVGTLVIVPAYFVLIPDVKVLGTAQWPAPSALVWRGVAELLAHGVGSLDPTARIGLVAGAVIGVLLPLLELKLPKYKNYIPSAIGVGLAFTITGYTAVSFFVGAVIAYWFSKVRPALAEQYTVPVSSGIIAAESVVGVLIALLTVRGWLG
ncbi:MAG TPA: OPT family oligopeptide transporter [Vicinamibacterales bacterium]